MVQKNAELLATEKERQRLAIARDIEAFIARGGRIDILLEPRSHTEEILRSIEERMVGMPSDWP